MRAKCSCRSGKSTLSEGFYQLANDVLEKNLEKSEKEYNVILKENEKYNDAKNVLSL